MVTSENDLQKTIINPFQSATCTPIITRGFRNTHTHKHTQEPTQAHLQAQPDKGNSGRQGSSRRYCRYKPARLRLAVAVVLIVLVALAAVATSSVRCRCRRSSLVAAAAVRRVQHVSRHQLQTAPFIIVIMIDGWDYVWCVRLVRCVIIRLSVLLIRMRVLFL